MGEMEKQKLLVVEDEEGIRTQMKWALIEHHDVFLATDGEKAMEIMESEHPPLVTLDLGLPPHPEDTSEGLKLLAQILRYDPSTKVIVVTGNPDRKAALEAISLGAHDFFTKPIEIDELKAILKRAYYVYTLEAEYRALQGKLQQRSFGEIIGSSVEMEEIFTTIRKVATTEVPVLITGESGTGKELIARAIHNAGIRQKKPFVAINCGAIPENLMESELFGHEKGAFTGAHMRRKGRIELAEGGTLLLDEVAELPLALQVKVLRFLQDHTLEKVGGRESVAVDCRVIAATNRDIKKMVSDGHFREDLYFRLAVVSIEIPPLRKRDDDVLLLTNAFLQEYSTGRSFKSLSEEAIKAISSYEWPGNVRELQNRIKRAIILSEGSAITPVDLGLQSVTIRERSFNLRKAKEELEKRYITMAMLKSQNNVSKAAEELGLARPTLHTFLKKYNIKH